MNNNPNSHIIIDLTKLEHRKQLAKMLTRLFDLWQLDTATQLNLLGLSESSRAMLAKYRHGEAAVANSRDSLDRAGYLLAIHKALRLLYPQNKNIRYSWVNRRNQTLANLTPINIMREQGILGLAKICRFLDYLRGR